MFSLSQIYGMKLSDIAQEPIVLKDLAQISLLDEEKKIENLGSITEVRKFCAWFAAIHKELNMQLNSPLTSDSLRHIIHNLDDITKICSKMNEHMIAIAKKQGNIEGYV